MEFELFLDNASQVLALLTGLIGLIGTGISTYFAIKSKFMALKEKTSQEHWAIIMEMADAAIIEAEASKAAGETKKQMVLDSITASAKAAGIDIQDFTEQLSLYIDQTIAFINKMKTKQDLLE